MSNKQTTAMQICIKQMEERLLYLRNIGSHYLAEEVKGCIIIATELLPKEQDIIEQAVEYTGSCITKYLKGRLAESSVLRGDEYFTQTFKQD